VRFYIDLINEAYRTGASEPLRTYADPECDSCSSIADAVDDIYTNGSARGGQIIIQNITPTVVTGGVQPSVVVNTIRTELQRLDASGQSVETLPRATRVLIFDLTWEPQWRLEAIRTGRNADS